MENFPILFKTHHIYHNMDAVGLTDSYQSLGHICKKKCPPVYIYEYILSYILQVGHCYNEQKRPEWSISICL